MPFECAFMNLHKRLIELSQNPLRSYSCGEVRRCFNVVFGLFLEQQHLNMSTQNQSKLTFSIVKIQTIFNVMVCYIVYI